MKLLGNIIWFIFGGFLSAIGYAIAGLLFCATIVGIPLGLQLFKYARLMLSPFGHEVKINFNAHPIANIIWIIFCGWEMCLFNIFVGVIFCITIIGIPFGLQWFKFGKLALAPFGAKIK